MIQSLFKRMIEKQGIFEGGGSGMGVSGMGGGVCMGMYVSGPN